MSEWKDPKPGERYEVVMDPASDETDDSFTVVHENYEYTFGRYAHGRWPVVATIEDHPAPWFSLPDRSDRAGAYVPPTWQRPDGETFEMSAFVPGPMYHGRPLLLDPVHWSIVHWVRFDRFAWLSDEGRDVLGGAAFLLAVGALLWLALVIGGR